MQAGWLSRLLEKARRASGLPAWAWGAALLALVFMAALLGRTALAGPDDPADPAGLVVDLMVKLSLILAAIYLGLFVFRRLKAGTRWAGARRMQIVETSRLSPRQSILLVRVDQRGFLLGATDHSLTLLAEVGLAETMPSPARLPGDTVSPFAATLAETVAGAGGATAPELRQHGPA